MCNFIDKWVFVLGGKSDHKGDALDTVELYDIERDAWTHAPKLARPMYGQSTICF